MLHFIKSLFQQLDDSYCIILDVLKRCLSSVLSNILPNITKFWSTTY